MQAWSMLIVGSHSSSEKTREVDAPRQPQKVGEEEPQVNFTSGIVYLSFCLRYLLRLVLQRLQRRIVSIMTSRQPSGFTGAPPRNTASTSTSTSSYRRNLLSASHPQHPVPRQQLRHPTLSSTASSAETVHHTQDDSNLEPYPHLDPASPEPATRPDAVRNDIIIRDEHGQFEVDQPVPAPAMDGDGDDIDGEGNHSKADVRLIELWRSHSRQHIDAGGKRSALSNKACAMADAVPAELHAAVQASLQSKVASLDDDKWMYEPEGETENLQV